VHVHSFIFPLTSRSLPHDQSISEETELEAEGRGPALALWDDYPVSACLEGHYAQ